ncbi:Endoglucanase C307 precursor [Lacunisphaera limnophila]|uniref:Endoglucanase C307 n=1 Tax=Lacunisphaera limnophila TaxID=1838286 RepID=A0A1D8AVB1_9BACT|nr:cellulase family glycosylhydrolase [Lacunisphaera limnophila]AOS44786.1 Endoglucanase C307 precursor [Lacunisphaera limnophila]
MNSSRRDFLKLAGGAGLAAALPGGVTATATPPRSTTNPLPRWRGFNLQYLYRPGPAMLKPDEDHFRWIAGWGFDFVRLPLNYRTWLKNKAPANELIKPEDVYDLDESTLALVDQAVELGGRHGVHVCLCFHHAPGYRVGKNVSEPFVLWRDPAAVEAFTFHWNLFARRYRDIPADRLSFNLFNEAPWPNDNFNGAIYRHAVTPAVAAIRKHRPDRMIIADGAGAGNLPVPELIPLGVHQSVHCYIPGSLSHYQVDWMKDRTDWPVPQWPGALGDGDYRWDRERLELYYSSWQDLLAQGVGVHMGETGGSHRVPASISRAWLGDVLGVCRDLGIGWALWDFLGQSKFGILDSERNDVAYEDWYGHKLDRTMLELLQRS